MKKWVDLTYEVGDIVYLKTDSDQSKRIVTAILLKTNGHSYELSCGTVVSWHFDFEMSKSADLILKTND